jgi:hypothetical protein
VKRLDIKGHIVYVFNELMPFRTLWEGVDGRLRLEASRNACDEDPFCHRGGVKCRWMCWIIIFDDDFFERVLFDGAVCCGFRLQSNLSRTISRTWRTVMTWRTARTWKTPRQSIECGLM